MRTLKYRTNIKFDDFTSFVSGCAIIEERLMSAEQFDYALREVQSNKIFDYVLTEAIVKEIERRGSL